MTDNNSSVERCYLHLWWLYWIESDQVCMCQLLVVAVDETWHWIALSLSPTTPPTPAGPHPHQSSSASKPHPSQYFPSMVISCRNQPLMDGEHSKNKKSLWGRRYIEGNVWNRCHEYFIGSIQIQSQTHFSLRPGNSHFSWEFSGWKLRCLRKWFKGLGLAKKGINCRNGHW